MKALKAFMIPIKTDAERESGQCFYRRYYHSKHILTMLLSQELPTTFLIASAHETFNNWPFKKARLLISYY